MDRYQEMLDYTSFPFHQIRYVLEQYKKEVRSAGVILGLPNHERVTFKVEAANDILGMLRELAEEKGTGEKA